MNRVLMPFLFLVTSGGLFLTWINPRYKEIQVAREEIARLEELNVKATTLRDDRARLLAKYQSIGDEQERRLMKLLPDHADNIQLLLDIKNAAATYGITIQDISLEGEGQKKVGKTTKVTESALYGETQVGFSVEARYPDFVSFLRDIEQSLRLVDVRELTVSQEESVSDRQKYELTVATYWLKP